MKDFKKALTSKEINEKLKELGEKKPLWIIQVLKDLKLPKGKEYKNFNNPVPNPEIIKNLISLLNEKEENIELNKNIISISYKFWHKEYIDLIIQKCIHILNYYNQQNVSSINSPIELVLGIIENMPERVPPNLSLGIADQLWSLYTRCPNQEEKVKIMKSYILSVSSIPRSQIGNRFTNIIGQIAAYNLPYFKEIFKFISKYKKIDGNWRWNLENNIIQSSLNNILNNPIESNLNKFNFIYSKKRRFIQDNELKQIIIKIVTQSSDNVFEIWRSQLIKATIKEKNLRESIINELKKKIEDPNFQIPKDRRRKILDFLLEVIKKLHDDSLNTQIGEWIFKFSEISHLQPLFPQYLNEANNLLRSKFRTYINAKVKNLCSKNLDFINSQLFVLNAYLKFQNKLDREALIFFTDVLIRAIQSRNSTFVNMAYNLLVEGVKIDTRKKRDLIDSIESLILHFPQEKEKWERILSELKISKRKMKK